MAWTNDDLQEIERAIATGELTVRFNDRLVTYRSIDDLMKARAVILRSVRASAGARNYAVARFD